MPKKKNIVFIFTDTTNRHHLSCYGGRGMPTPNHDRLASEGVRFDNCYSASPVCTPDRGCVFTGVNTPANGCWYNDATPFKNLPMMGDIFADGGYRVGYSGKWHLDGGLYLGYGRAEGGFPQRWWYDGKNYTDDLGPEKTKIWKAFSRGGWDAMLENAFPEEDCWAHRVVDRAIDFLQTADDEPFLFVAAFDEPHAPFMCPRRFLEAIDPNDYVHRPNVNAPLDGKPEHHKLLAEGHDNAEDDLRDFWRYFAACNAFADYELGRLLDAVERLHGEDTIVVFSSDHGEQMGSHGCWGKGYMMYEESVHTPLMVRGPGIHRGGVATGPVSHVDFLPTFCELAGIEPSRFVQGTSFAPTLADPVVRTREAVMATHTRFGNHSEPRRKNEEDLGEYDRKATQEFHPIRMAADGRYKLVINLFEIDEFYDLESDPYEMTNRIDDPATAAERDRLHDWLLLEMVQTVDPIRCRRFRDRPWRKIKENS